MFAREMAARLGAVTGAEHARLITARFGRRWGGFALADLLALNLLTLVTEFVGVSMSLGYFGISRFISVPVAAAFLIAVTAPGSFRGWERAMYVLIAASLAAVPLAMIAWAHRGQAAAGAAAGTAHGGAVFLAVALVGTTVAPWQLFFQQSNVVDKRITTRFLGYERADTALGAADRRTWTMPPIESLRPPARSAWSYSAATSSPRSPSWGCGPSSSRWAPARSPDRDRSQVPGERDHRPFG